MIPLLFNVELDLRTSFAIAVAIMICCLVLALIFWAGLARRRDQVYELSGERVLTEGES